MRKLILILLIILLVCVFVLSGLNVLKIWLEYREGEVFYEDLDQYVSIPEPTEKRKPVFNKKPAVTQPTEETVEEADPVQWPEVDFDALLEVNSDVVGWIYIPDTNVNYPIVQGQDNKQYLYRLLDGKYNSAGTIFLEAGIAPDFSWQNNPIYGHNMKNGTMFAQISGYKKQEFFDAHPIALLMTPEKNYIVRLFSGYVTDIWGDAWEVSFSESGFSGWLEKVQQKSRFTAQVQPTTEDRILTLSTCSYEINDARFVVHGVLEEYPKKNTTD